MPNFASIRVEGGLLGPEILDELLAGSLPGQKPADFGLAPRRNLTDEIAGAFADARALWGVFQHRLARLGAEDIATSVTRDAWMVPLLGLLGYELRYEAKARELDGLSFPVSHRLGEADDAPALHIVGARQELGRVPATGRPRMAPHSLIQEFLNRSEQVWGIVSNGLTLRLLRDCTFVRRQSYLEFDLQSLFDQQQFQDFAALYRLLHRTRLPLGTADAADCLLEKYHAHSLIQGGRVREHLRDGVEECITILGNGFLRHGANNDLRDRAHAALGARRADAAPLDITADDFYRQLLRLVYRFLFLLVSEDRGLLSKLGIYREHYSINRLRRLVDLRAAYSEHDDLWQSLRVLWRLLVRDDPGPDGQPLAAMLGLPVLNGELFALQDLDDCTIANADLLGALWRLMWYQESRSSPPRRVNYAALDVEELGSVYESLLEFHPAIQSDPQSSGAVMFSLLPGAERKSTGSYYTPPELVNELVKSALEPVLLVPRPSPLAAQNILSLRICDPACGSGHFLLAAARRLGKELARIRTGDDEPSPESLREAIREVIAHCIYGVDKNPLAVDLCRVALWLESHTADKPLTFLDHRIRCGDSLVGVFNLETLKDGIPDKAFEPLEGDDKTSARSLARVNREQRKGVRSLFDFNATAALGEFTQHSQELAGITDDSPEAIRTKKRLFDQSHADPAWARQKLACDLWTAAFFQPLQADAPAITSSVLAEHLAGRQIDPRIKGLATAIAIKQRFFHWPLEFPEVFSAGGFDVILSNPPWERVKLQEQEFFAARDADIANAPNKAARARLIKALQEKKPALYREFTTALRDASAASSFMRHSGRNPLTGRGDINTYAIFAEFGTFGIKSGGRAGLILPKGIATDDTTKHYFNYLVEKGRLISLTGFENEDFIFPAVDHRVTFCTLVVGGGAQPVRQSRIAFYIRRFAQLNEEHRFFQLESSDFWLLNPNTGNCPIFRTQADAELTKAIYRRVPILWREARDGQPEVNPWRLSFKTLFHMANDSHHFHTKEDLEGQGYRLEGNIFVGPGDRYLPLYEAKMLHQFDHRYSTYEGATQKQLNVGILPQPTAEQKRDPSFVVQPRYWVREDIVNAAIPRYPDMLAKALDPADLRFIQMALLVWIAGYHLAQNNKQAAEVALESARRLNAAESLGGIMGSAMFDHWAVEMQRDFPLSEADFRRIIDNAADLEKIARELVERFSPRWFFGWRDITNAGNERTTISTVVPRSAVGDAFLLMFPVGDRAQKSSCLVANLNSFVQDHCARQKVGGMHMKYNVFRQLPVLPPDRADAELPWTTMTLKHWLAPRTLELVHTSNELAEYPSSAERPPFPWDEARRFEIRCELDAAFFHLYLPCDDQGGWRPAEGESAEQLAALKKHFPAPRDAVAFIMDQFPIVRGKDEKAHGRYRTKDRILEIYDAMLEAQRSGRPYETNLDPPPGQRPGGA